MCMYQKTVIRDVPTHAKIGYKTEVRKVDGVETKVKVTYARFKRKGELLEREVREDGKMLDLTQTWYAKVKLPDGSWKDVALCKDKQASQVKLAEEMKYYGNPDRIKYGLDLDRTILNTPLDGLIDSFIKVKVGKKRKKHYISTTRKGLEKILTILKWKVVGDVANKDSGKQVQVVLNQLEDVKNYELRALGTEAKYQTKAPVELPDRDRIGHHELTKLLNIQSGHLGRVATNKGITGTGGGRGRQRWYTREEAEALIGRRNSGWSNATINKYRNILDDFCNHLIKNQYIINKPVLPENKDVKASRRKKRRAMEWKQCLALCANIEKMGYTRINIYTAQYRSILYRVAFCTLLRKGTLANICKKHIIHVKKRKDERVYIAVEQDNDKNEEARQVCVADKQTAKELLAFIAGMKEEDKVFDVPPNISSCLYRDLNDAGMPIYIGTNVFDFHAFRHSGATHLWKKGVDPTKIMKIGGWTSLTMLMKVYGHLSPKDLGDVVQGIF